MVDRGRARMALVGIAGLGLAALVRAEPASEAAPPAAQGSDAPIEHTTPAVQVEAFAPAELPEDPTSFTRVIEVEERAEEGQTLEELLETVPGVHVRRFGGPGGPSEISIRGSSGSQVVVLLDGVRLNSAQTGAVDLSTVPLELLERVEVNRGGGSVQSGSDAIGGVVNLVTKPVSARPVTRVVGSAGSFETWQGTISQTGRIGDLEALAGYDVFKTSGDWEFEPIQPDDTGSVERINNRSERHAGLLKLARDFGDRLRVELEDQILHSSDGRPGLDDPAGGANRGQSPVGHQRRTRNIAQVTLLGGDLTPLGLGAELRAFHRFDRSRFHDSSLTPEVDSDDRNTSYGGRANVRGETRLGPLRLAPSLGSELRRDELDAKETDFRARRVFGVWTQTELSLLEDRVLLVPALRYDDTEGVGEEWIPRVGLRVAPLPGVELRANAERSYRVPNYDELYLDEGSLRGDPGLQPEDSWDADAGLRLAFEPAGPLRFASLEAVGFYRDIDNTIVWQLVNPNVVAASNLGNVRVSGVELSGQLDPSDWLRVSGSYTHLDTEVRDTGNPLPGRPDDEYDVRLELRPLDGRVKLVGEMLYTGEIPVNEGGRLVLSDHTTFDVSATLELHRFFGLGERLGVSGLLLSASATNVTDRAVRDALSFPQPGRVVSFRLEVWR